MDILIVTLWLLGIIISHLLLRRVVEIDNINKKLLGEIKPKPLNKEQVNQVDIVEMSDEDLKQELLDYVTAQDYELPKPEFQKNNVMQNISMTEIGIPIPTDATNVVQEFEKERSLNTGMFGNLQAYEDVGYASL